jgi:hypothetical protein
MKELITRFPIMRVFPKFVPYYSIIKEAYQILEKIEDTPEL